MTKRIIALVIAVMMVVSLMPMGIFAYDTAPTDEIVRQTGVFFDDAEWVALDGTPIVVNGDGGLAGEYTTETHPVTMSLLFEVKGVRTPVTFGKVNWATLGTGAETWVESTNCGEYAMDTSYTLNKDGVYAIQVGFYEVNWFGSTFELVKKVTLFGGSRGVDFSSENPNALIRPLALVESSASYDVTFCNADGTEIVNVPGSAQVCGLWSSRIDAIPTLEDLYTGETPEKAETEQYRYEFLGWQTADGTPVDYATFCGKVYPIFREIDKSKAYVTFVGAEGETLATASTAPGGTVSYDGETPVKHEDTDNVYVFAGWKNAAGEDVDLAAYTFDTDETLTASFVSDAKLKAVLVEKTPIKLFGTGVYGIKLNRTDITTDILAGTKAEIESGFVEIASDLTNSEGMTAFTVNFSAVDANGMTDAEFTLTDGTGYAGKHSVVLSGSVVSADNNVGAISPNTSTVAITDQQLGSYFPEGEGVLINKNGEDGSAPASQKIFSGNVNFVDKQPGFTFVIKATGVNTPINLGPINFAINGRANYYDQHWYYFNPFWGGATESSRGMTVYEDGYYLFYHNNRLWDDVKVSAVNEINIFYLHDIVEGEKPKENKNEDARIQVLAIVANNLQPVITFHDAEGGVHTTYTYKYTDVGSERVEDGNIAKQTKALVLVGDAVAIANVTEPVKKSDEENTYIFDKWVDAEGNEIDSDLLYMSIDLYPTYTAKPKTTKYDVTFESDGVAVDTQSVWEDEFASAPADPAKADDATGYYTFEGWSLDGVTVIDPATVAITANTTFKAVYSHTNVEFTVTYVSGKNDKDEDIVFGKETVVRSEDAILSGTPKYATDAYTVNKEAYYHRFVKWVDAEGNAADLTNIQSDLTVYADVEDVLVENWYKVTWQEEDGTVLEVKYVAEGDGTSTGVKGAMDGKADETKWYHFSSWDKTTTEITEDTYVTSQYTYTPVDTSSVATAYTASGKVTEENVVLFGKDNEHAPTDAWISFLVKIEGASEANPVTLAGPRTLIMDNPSLTIDSNNSGNYAENVPMINSVSVDGYYYVNISLNRFTWCKTTQINSLIFNDKNANKRGGKSADESGEATFSVMYKDGQFVPEIRFYDADGTWLATNKIEETASYVAKYVPTAVDMYNGADLGENFLYWADKDGKAVTQLTDSMDVYAVYDTPAYTLGDVNNDGKVNGDDVSDLSRYVAGWPGAALESEPAADVNGDGKINGDDVSDLSRYVAGWPGADIG